MFPTSKSIFDLPTYPRVKLPLAGSPQAQPQPAVRVPYRPIDQASPRPPEDTIPLYFRELPAPSQRQQAAAAPAPSLPPAQPQQTSPTVAPSPQAPTAAADQQSGTKPTTPGPQPHSRPASTPAPSLPQTPAQQTPPTASPAPQSTEEDPKVAAALKEAAAQAEAESAARHQAPTAAPSPQTLTAAPGQQPTPKPAASTPPPQPQQQPPTKPDPSPSPTPNPTPASTEEDPRVVAALKEAGAQVEAESAVRKQRETRRTKLESSGMGGAATSLDALDDEAAARRAELEKKYPQRGPEYEAGIQTLAQHLQQQQSQIKAKAQQLPGIAAQIYQQWGKGVAGNWITGAAPKEGDAYSPGAPLSSTHLAVLEQEAQKYGVGPKDLRHHLEMQRLSDWSRASTSYANWKQENIVNKTLRSWDGSGPVEPARVLPNGRITVNPTLGEDQATFDKAIDKTDSTPEAKEAARKLWPAYHDRWLASATETLKTSKRLPGMQDYNEWLTSNQLAGHFSEKRPDGTVRPYTDNEKTQLYLDAMKSRPGWLKLAENLGTSLTAGGGQIIAGGMGLAAMGAGAVEYATGLDVGGQELSEAAAEKAQENKALTQSHELTGTTDGFGTRLISSLSQALPSTVLGMVTGGPAAQATRAAVMSALQTAGGQYAETYGNNIKSGMPHDEAFARSASAAAFSGVMSGVLTKYFPGGTTALSSSALRSTLSTGASGTALRDSIKDAIKAYAATTVHGAKALARGTLDEIPQEVLDEGISQLSSAWAEKKDMKQAMADFFTGLPQLVATSGILGAGGEHIAQSAHNNAQTAQSQSQPQIPVNTTQADTGSSAPSSGQQPQTSSSPSPSAARPSRPPLDEETSKKLITNVEKIPAHRPLNPVEQADLDQAKGVVTAAAQKIIDNISKMPPQAQQDPKVQVKLAEARKTVADHGPKPENQPAQPQDAQKKQPVAAQPPQAPATSTQSSSGNLPSGDTATAHDVSPPAGTHTSTANADGTTTVTAGTGGRTSTASSGDSIPTTSPGGSTHTTNGVAAPPVGYGNRIPEDTTHPGHIDLADRRVENLEKIAAKRKLDPHEQGIYENALRVRDRTNPAQTGDSNNPPPSGNRNTGSPQDLVMAGGDAPTSQTQGAAVETPPPSAPTQPTTAIGSTINDPGKTNPNAPTASAETPTPPPPAGPAGAPQTTGPSASVPSIPTSTASTPPASNSEGRELPVSGSGSPPNTSSPGSNSQPASTTADKPVISSTSSTANPVQAKRRLAEEGYPPQAVKKYVNDNYDASKYKDLGGPDTVWLVMPSTSGKNTIPLSFAKRLAADNGGAVITDGFSMNQTGQAKNKRGYMAKMDALPQVDIHDPALLAKLAGKKVVIVDDIMTSGVTSDALTEALAAKGIQTQATAVLAAVKDGAPAHPSQLKELAQTIAESTGRPLKEVLAQVKLAHGGSRGKLVVEALREAREHPNEVYERITRKAETLRTPSRGGK